MFQNNYSQATGIESPTEIIDEDAEQEGTKVTSYKLNTLMIKLQFFWKHTLLDTTGKPQRVRVATINKKTNTIRSIHGLDDAKCLPSETKLGKLGKQCRAPNRVVSLDF